MRLLSFGLSRRAGVVVCAVLVMIVAQAAPALAITCPVDSPHSGPSDPKPTTTKEKKPVKAPPMADQTIPGTPIRTVVRDSGSAAVYYNEVGQFYSDNAEGVFVWANNQVWGPNDEPFGPTVNAYTPVSNVLSGSGTAQSPWQITTVLSLGTTGLQLIRSVRYVDGTLYTRQDFEVRNTGTRTYTINLFHAADLQTSGDGSGYGYYDSGSGAIGGYNQARTFYQIFVPITGGSRYKEGLWSDIWAAIGNTTGAGPGFDNSYHPDTYEDNAAGLQWSFALQPGTRYDIADFHSFTTSVGCTVNFRDVLPDDFYFEPVSYLACNGIVSGYADNTFRPGANTTRAQLSKIMVVAEGWNIDTTGGPHFTDVPSSNPFYTYVETAYHHGVISGYVDGTFRPGNNVNRGQLSKIIVSAEGWPIDTTGGPHFLDVSTTYPFYQWIETAYHHGIISGYVDGTFRPGTNATRGQIGKIVYLAVTGQ